MYIVSREFLADGSPDWNTAIDAAFHKDRYYVLFPDHILCFDLQDRAARFMKFDISAAIPQNPVSGAVNSLDSGVTFQPQAIGTFDENKLWVVAPLPLENGQIEGDRNYLLYELFAGTDDLTYTYRSGTNVDAGLAPIKLLSRVFVTYQGSNTTVNIFDENGKSLMANGTPDTLPDSNDIAIAECGLADRRCSGLSVQIRGKGKVYEVNWDDQPLPMQ